MSTLTKICIVVLVVLLLFACPVFIQQAVMPPNWKQAYNSEKDRRKLAEAEASNQQMAAQVWQRFYETAKSEAGSNARQFLSTLGSKDVRIGQLTQQLAECSAHMNELSASLKASEQNMSGQINLNKTLTTQLDTKRTECIKLRDQLRRAQDSITEYLANIEILTKSVRVLKEQDTHRVTEVSDLRAQLEASGIKVDQARVAPKLPKIEAEITAVKDDLASLNIGSASGVKKDMEFVIYRGADFVAHLRIADVSVSSSAGIIIDATREVKVGDKAATAASLE